jgi:hypothetical protein
MHTVNHTDLAATINGVANDLDDAADGLGPARVSASRTIARQARRQTHGALLIDIRLSQYDSVDLRGIPSPEQRHDRLEHALAPCPSSATTRSPTTS